MVYAHHSIKRSLELKLESQHRFLFEWRNVTYEYAKFAVLLQLEGINNVNIWNKIRNVQRSKRTSCDISKQTELICVSLVVFTSNMYLKVAQPHRKVQLLWFFNPRKRGICPNSLYVHREKTVIAKLWLRKTELSLYLFLRITGLRTLVICQLIEI